MFKIPSLKRFNDGILLFESNDVSDIRDGDILLHHRNEILDQFFQTKQQRQESYVEVEEWKVYFCEQYEATSYCSVCEVLSFEYQCGKCCSYFHYDQKRRNHKVIPILEGQKVIGESKFEDVEEELKDWSFSFKKSPRLLGAQKTKEITKTFSFSSIIVPRDQQDIKQATPKKCTKHGSKIEFFCADCSDFICIVCVGKEGTHRNHNFHDFKTSEYETQDELKHIEDFIHGKIEQYQNSIKEKDNKLKTIYERMDKIKNDVEKKTKELYSSIEQRMKMIEIEQKEEFVFYQNSIEMKKKEYQAMLQSTKEVLMEIEKINKNKEKNPFLYIKDGRVFANSFDENKYKIQEVEEKELKFKTDHQNIDISKQLSIIKEMNTNDIVSPSWPLNLPENFEVQIDCEIASSFNQKTNELWIKSSSQSSVIHCVNYTGRKIRHFHLPCPSDRVSTDQDGNIYSCDAENTYYKLDSSLNKIWHSSPKIRGTVVGIYFDIKENALWGLYKNRTIVKLDKTNGEILDKFILETTEKEPLQDPSNVIRYKNYIIVSDKFDLKCFDMKGKYDDLLTGYFYSSLVVINDTLYVCKRNQTKWSQMFI